MLQEIGEFEEIGVSEAKARLSELLRKVSQGRYYLIKVRGKRTAYLIPSYTNTAHDVDVAINAMRAFPKVQSVTAKDIQAMIAEGRR